MHKKPIVRWTVGPPRSKFDDLILRRSISNFRSIYGDIFDYVACLNGRPSSGLESLGVELFVQEPVRGMPGPRHVAWKLYPPRLRPESHEIFIDHDVVILERIRKVDELLSSVDAFMCSSSSPPNRNYGRFDLLIGEGFHLNSGLFGLPPHFNFDFGLVGEWSDYFDEQGFVAASLCHQTNLIRLGLDDIWICDGDSLPIATKGYHFVHERRDEMWKKFVRMTTI